MTGDCRQLIEAHLGDWRTGWSMGSFGAIAEFHRDETEPTRVERNGRLSLATDRGGIAFDSAALGNIVPVAYETLSPKRHRWGQAIALCLPEMSARRPARAVLTELGPDNAAIHGHGNGSILFDLGLALPQCDFCIRTNASELLAVLRANLGRPLFEPGNALVGVLLAAHPHRVVITNVGRTEVYQRIGGPETGGVSPEGPHTHLLPKLLMSGRTHSANTPIPAGLLPFGALHPANPVMSATGRDQPFDSGNYDAFQVLLARFGVPEIVVAKALALKAFDDGATPASFAVPSDRLQRAAVRLALRQQARIAEQAGDAALRGRVREWLDVHDAAASDADEDDDAPGH